MKTSGTPPRRALLVLGMHRSGTSAVARVVNLLGAELGNDLVPAGPDNPEGFWEHAETVRINDELLCGLGRTWYDMRGMPDGWVDSPFAKSAMQRIVKLIERDFAASSLCAIKDPRMCLTAPLWIEAFETRGFEVDCLFVVRNPGEVVESLHRRNDWPRDSLYLMWAQYLMEATAASESRRRAIITYDQLLSDWRGSMVRVARGLHLRWPVMPDETVSNTVNAFLDPGHKHHQEPPCEAGSEGAVIPGLAVTLYQACLGITSGEEKWTAISDLHDSFRETARLYAAHVDHLLDERWSAEERALTAEARLAEQAPVTTVVRDTAQALQERLDSSVQQLQNEMSALSGEIAARFERQRESMMAVEARIQRQHALLNTISLRLEQTTNGQVAGSAGVINARPRVEVRELQSALASSNATIAALTTSTSWKLTAPLRWLSVHVLRRPPASVEPVALEPVAPGSRGDELPDTISVHRDTASADAAVESVTAVGRERLDRRNGTPGPVEFRWKQGPLRVPIGDR